MLAEYQGKIPECYPSQEMLAVPLGVKVRQLQSFIKELESYMRVDPPEPFPLIEAKRVFVEKDRKTRNIYKLLWWPFLALDLKANGAERSYSADGGNAQYPAHRSEGEAQEAAPSPEAMPGEEGGAVPNGTPPSDAQSSAHPGGDAQDTAAALPEMLSEDSGLAPHGMPPSDTQSTAHRSMSDKRDSRTAPPATPGEHGGVTPDGMGDMQSSAYQSEGATPDTVARRRTMSNEEGDAQYSAHRSGSGAQDAGPSPPDIPRRKVGAVPTGNPLRAAHSSVS